MDETDSPQTPVELLIVLAAVAEEGIPIQTIAPKFSGRFDKGVDYVGDLAKFTEEFSNDVAAIAFAVRHYGMSSNLKLSVHSGSDKFSLYGPIHRTLKRLDAGVHLKTAGTTWLEELIGLAEAGGEGLDLAKEIYDEAYSQREELGAPYAAVININPAQLPAPELVGGVVVGTVCVRPTSRPKMFGLQHQPSPTSPRGLQGGRENGNPLSGSPVRYGDHHSQECDREPFRPPPQAVVHWGVMEF